jgi:hypothetical protein
LEVLHLPQTLDSLPPPSIQWRRESDEERKQRLEGSGVLEAPVSSNSRPEAAGQPAVGTTSPIGRFRQEALQNKEKSKKSYLLWWSADLARWQALRSPTNTKTLADGSFSVGAEISHPEWLIGTAIFSFGPRAFFYNGAQYAKLVDPFFKGYGFANFSSSEIGMSANYSWYGSETVSGLRWLGAAGFAYTPVRWVSAEEKSSASMIPRSDTWSRIAINLPGLNLQTEIGADWNSLVQVGLFAGVHGAWPFQIRMRTGLRLSMGMSLNER